ncbi:MAG: PadR family transcriptional regulator [Candidatus Bathyarchaeota archaeon]|nr:PadR family transcriptional regulator [Candidatus Bathyarchaeota archaeon]
MEETVQASDAFIRDVERRILNNFMDLLILLTLYSHGGQISGYDIIKYMQANYRFLPSPGNVYSYLYHMERKGLLRGFQIGRKRVYSLTRRGTETAQTILKAKERIINLISTIFYKNANINSSAPQIMMKASSRKTPVENHSASLLNPHISPTNNA